MIKKYKAKLTVKTPVHIAGADYKNLTPYEYIVENGDLKIIDNNKFMDVLTKKNLLDEYIDTIHRNVNLGKHEQKRKIEITYFLRNNSINIDTISKKTYKSVIDKSVKVNNGINMHIKDIYDNPYIPGSSIKGALVNFLLVDYIISHRGEFTREIEKIKRLNSQRFNFNNKRDVKNFQNAVKKEVENVIDKILYDDKNPRVKRFGLSISDTYSKKDVEVSFLQDIDLHLPVPEYEGEGRTHMPIAREYIMRNNEFSLDITLDTEMLALSKLKIQNGDDLIKAINNAFKYLSDNSLEDYPRDSGLIIGANTGFHQKTIIHALFEDNELKTEVTKKLIHKIIESKNKKMGDHKGDTISPRILNIVEWIDSTREPDNDIAGIIELELKEDKNAY